VPYGYVYNKATKKPIINEVEARIVRRIYSEYSEGKTLYGICEGLNKDKVPGRGKNCQGWRQTAVRQVLINPMYKGIQIVNRHAHISDISKIDLSKAIQIRVPATITEQVWQFAQERLKNNTHVKPKNQGEFLLQGMVTCGVCGYAYRAERVNGTKYYLCRGRMKYHHLDGSPRCKSPCFKAEWLENEVWQQMEEIIDDPNRLFAVIKDTIENLRMKEADLSARIRPIDERLAEIAEQKAKLADDWVIRHMYNDKFRELKDNLDREETRIRALRAEIDPAQIEELESTKGVLRFWESQIKSMAWNTENEDGSMVRLVDKPHQVALKVVGFEDRRLGDALGFPASRRELLDKLKVKLVVFNDRIEVNGLFPIQPIDIQLCTSTRGRGQRG
jgi:site-specific DNA recombinase